MSTPTITSTRAGLEAHRANQIESAAEQVGPYIYGATDEESAHVVEGWPWGRRMRCTKRFWIETTKNGDRLCAQCTQPDRESGQCSGQGCKPKKSTYTPGVIVLAQDTDGTMARETLGRFDNHSAAEIESFVERHEGRLTDIQASRARSALAMRKKYDERLADQGTPGRYDHHNEAIRIVPLHSKQ